MSGGQRPVTEIWQGLFVGAVAGLCVGFLRHYLLETGESLAKSVSAHIPGLAAGVLTFRCLMTSTSEAELAKWFASPASGKTTS